jgi:GTP-binding protein YchF
MQLGIVGLPASGKTTIFRALTGGGRSSGAPTSGGKPEVHTAVVDVPDPRLDALSSLYHPKKTVYAKITYADIGGIARRAKEPAREGFPAPLLNLLSQMDGLLQVVRAFEDPNVAHPAGSVDPARDLATLRSEFLLNDMVVVERRLQKLAEERQKGGRERGAVEREASLFERLDATLQAEHPLRGLDLKPEEERLLAGFGLITLKPTLIVVNLSEGQPAPDLGSPGPRSAILPLQGKLEMEIAELPAGEAAEFLAEYGLEEPGLRRVIRASYDLLGLQSFFTVSEEEVHAWRLPRGGTALEAAGTVHSDMARGFIRAEVIAWDELLALGGLSEARAHGKLRLEGKDYPVQEGEVVHIRFNV